MALRYSNEHIDQAISKVRESTQVIPRVGIILGSGMSDLADQVDDRVSIPYSEIPHLQSAGAPGHAGSLVLGTIAGVPCVLMQGRLHLYEGHSPEAVAFPVRLMRKLGAKLLVATNAAGGVNRQYSVGDLVLVEDHINIAGMSGLDPTRGTVATHFGPRFTPLNRAYDPALLDILEKSATELKIKTHRGVYGFTCGPSFETPAEVRFLHTIGVDAVGMSTVPEVITARHSGMTVAVISAITNLAVHELDSSHITTEDEVFENAPAILKNVTRLVLSFVAAVGG